MENSHAETPSTEPQTSTTDAKAALEVETILKETLKAIGRHTILAYEMENEQIQLDTINLNEAAMNPVITNRYTKQKEALNKKSQSLLAEETTSVNGISAIADKYKEIFSNRLNQVKEEIENAMIKYGEILSKDTIDQINKESSRLIAISNQHAENLETLSSDIKSKTQHLDTKLDEIKEVMETHSQDATKLFTANNKCIQANKTLDGKLTMVQQKMDLLSSHFEKKISSALSRTEAQTTAMEKISAVVSNKIKDDKEAFLKRLADLEEERQADKNLLESFKSEFKAIKQQLESLPSQNNADIVAASPSSQQDETPTSSSTQISSVLTDKEVVEMKATITNLQRKCKDLVHLVNSLVKDETTPTATVEALESLKANMSLKRLDEMEKNVVYLLSKVEVMEPRHKIDLAELKQLMESKGMLAKGQEPPALGDKRSLDMMNGATDDDEDKTRQLEVEVKRVDFKLESLVEYIHQFRSNVLNPSFPDRLDKGLQHMEQILRNHETFIAYLVDPVAACNTEKKTDSSQLTPAAYELEKQQDAPPTISPALLTAITKIIAEKTTMEYELQQTKKQKTTDKALPEHMEKHMARLMKEQMEPLQQRIKELEQQLKL